MCAQSRHPKVGDGVTGPHQSRCLRCMHVQRCWLCSASADDVTRRVYGALLVAMLVMCNISYNPVRLCVHVIGTPYK